MTRAHRQLFAWLLAGSSLCALACSSSEDDGARAEGELSCDEICARHIGCDNDPNALCPLYCTILRAECPEPSNELQACLLPKRDSDFECNDDGITQPRDSVCAEEQAAVEECADGLFD